MRYSIFTPLVVCLGLGSGIASAAERQIQGIVKSVDAEKSTLTVTVKKGGAEKDETLDVVKKAKVTINGEAAALKDVRRGQRVSVVFNSDLEVATKIDATGEGGAALVAEVVAVNELPEPELTRTAPWISGDGLTLFWKSRPETGQGQSWIWTARRATKDGFFEGPKRLLPGSDVTVSVDGLEAILLQGDSLWTTNRPTADAQFVRPKKVAELQGHGFLAVPAFSSNDLVLHVDQMVQNRPLRPVKFTRASRRASWSGPTTVKVALPRGISPRSFYATADGALAFCALIRPATGKERPPMEIAMMRAGKNGFDAPKVIMVGGEPLLGMFPRYSPATNELFFARIREPGKNGPWEIAVVRNFDPNTIETAAVADAQLPGRPDRVAIATAWASSRRSPTKDSRRKMTKQNDRYKIEDRR